MKIRVTVLVVAFLCLNSIAALAQTNQSPSKQSAPAPAIVPDPPGTAPTAEIKIDPHKEAAIRKLIEMSGGTKVVKEVMDGMQSNMKPMLSNAFPPGEYRDKLIDLFFERFRSKADLNVVVNLAVQSYDKYFSEDDINGLIQFYSTPIGQKSLAVMPKLTVELQTEGMKWGQDLGRQSMTEVMNEHPELRKAMEDAQKNNHPAQTH